MQGLRPGAFVAKIPKQQARHASHVVRAKDDAEKKQEQEGKKEQQEEVKDKKQAVAKVRTRHFLSALHCFPLLCGDEAYMPLHAVLGQSTHCISGRRFMRQHSSSRDPICIESHYSSVGRQV